MLSGWQLLLTEMISSKASIHKNAKIGKNVKIGDFCIIGENVEIGDDCQLLNTVNIQGNTVQLLLFKMEIPFNYLPL